MFKSSGPAKHPDYLTLEAQLLSLLEGEDDLSSNAAQFSAFIFETIADLNWAGIYLIKPAKNGKGSELLVGPFQGKVACTRIALGRGVCGTAAAERRTIMVADVHEFPGHIACDSASNSEIVIPLIKDGVLVGVLDLDSPSVNRFSIEDQLGLEMLAAAFVDATRF
jgi:L-methionine (R)-S-oxide reductase